jgi:electron transport complex protein RnfG
MSVSQPGPLRLVATLGVAGLAAGLALAVVYRTTLPRIERNRAEARRAAILQLMPGTERITRLSRGEQGELEKDPDESAPTVPGETAFSARDGSGELLGYAIPAEGPGYVDTIGLLYGYDPRRDVVVGLAVLESRETPGLGDRIITDEDFLENFRALAVEPQIVPVRKGEKSAPNEVDCITGATISSEAVVSILNRSLELWRETLRGREQGGESQP